jgi:hypothetical protein
VVLPPDVEEISTIGDPLISPPVDACASPPDAKSREDNKIINEIKPSISSLLCIELCCGSAGLSAALQRRGFSVLGVDWIRNPSLPQAPIVKLDLSKEEGQKIVRDVIRESDVCYIHAAVPCGTASKARNRPIASKFLRAGAPQPRPLRSKQFPLGFPTGLTALESERVQAANAIYKFVAELFDEYHDIVFWTIENPDSSFFWDIPFVMKLAALPTVRIGRFQQCMKGGRRPVWRRWMGNLPGLPKLNAECSGDHEHLPFRIQTVDGVWQFSTAEEAAYPKVLCDEASDLVLDGVLALGFSPPALSITDPNLNIPQQRQLMRATTGKFVRGKRLPQLLSEFDRTEQIVLAKPLLNETRELNGDYMKVVRLISRVTDGPHQDTDNYWDCIVGVYRKPSSFVEKAKELIHPMDMPAPLPDVILENIAWNLSKSTKEVSAFTLETIRRMKNLSLELKGRDEQLKRQAPPEILPIIKSKNVALLEYYMNKLNWPDKDLVNDLLYGIPLSGTVKPTKIFPPKVKTATITTEQLRASAKWCRKAILQKVGPSGDHDLDVTVWKQMEEECLKGWCRGPFDEQQITDLIGSDQWTCNRRFGLRQSAKVRDIDDYSESSVNDSITTLEKLDLHTVDDALSVLKTIFESLQSDGTVAVRRLHGNPIITKLHPSLSTKDALSWKGKTFDLKAAYKNLATKNEENWFAIVVLWSPEHRSRKFFTQTAIPFGATGSVIGFNRYSRFLWAVAAHELKIVWLSYFDDYPTFARADLSVITDVALKTFFLIFGWDVATSKEKTKPFEPAFNILGVRLDMSKLHEGKLACENKPERIAEISGEIGNIIESGRCLRPQAAALRGRAQFASNQLFGRMALAALAALSYHQFKSRTPFISESLREELSLFRELLSAGVPRQLGLLGERRPVLIFSDGAAEGVDFESVSVGAVLIDPVSKLKLMFGLKVPDEVVKFWKADDVGKVQTIGQAEILPAVLARVIWREQLQHRRILFFLDNDAARAALVRCASLSKSSRILVNYFAAVENVDQAWVWFARVPTSSNPADGPSRLRLAPAEENFFAEPVPGPLKEDLVKICIPSSFSSRTN